LLKYSPWLATRLKQSRSGKKNSISLIEFRFRFSLDIVKCLQDTIDVYDALAHQDFDRLFDKNNIEEDVTKNKTDTSVQPTPSFQFRPPPPPSTTTTTSSSLPSFSFAKTITTTADSTPSAGFTFKIPTTVSPEKQTNSSPFAFSMPNTGFGTVKS
jgi:hypothetical protein